VYQRLRTLVERGELETKATGANSRVWWRPPDAGDDGDGTRRGAGVGTEGSGDAAETGPQSDPALDADAESWVPAMRSVIDGLAIVDESGEYRNVNQSHAEIYGYDSPAALIGEHWAVCYGSDELARFEQDIIPSLRERGGWRGEATGQRKDGSTFRQELSLTETERGGIVCVVRDITERKERERQLQEARRFNEELVENAPFGMFRLDEELRITYENPRAEEIIGLPEDQASSAAIGLDISELPPIVETGQAAMFDRLADGETIEFEFPFESIYGKEAYFTGRAVPVYRDGEFDGAVLMATDISERRANERELERQREQLAALDGLNDVVRGITEAVIDQSTREEIERVVTDRLAGSDSYRAAWVGTVDGRQDLNVRVEAGISGCSDDVPLSPAPDAAVDRGPTERALATREIQVVQHAQQDPTFAAQATQAAALDYRAAAFIPITHQGVFYGVLGVYSARADAFAAAERAVVGQLGEVVGHAIAAVDRKRALMSDEMVELELRIPELVPPGELPAVDGRIQVDRLTPAGDDTFLLYGRATGDAIDVVEAMRDELPAWGRLRTVDAADGVRFEQRLSDAPLTSLIADHGGNFAQGTIRDGAFTATVQLPVGTDTRWVLDALTTEYPRLQVVRREQLDRDGATPDAIGSTFTERLTERQRLAVEAAYFGGYFDSPRLQSGEEIADSLDISPATFHQHVRKAQRRLLQVILTEL